MNNSINYLEDKRVNCISIMETTTIQNYLSLIKKIYEKKGGIEGQRDALKTSTAIRIRKRMVDDLQKGAVLPPVVIGLIVDDKTFLNLPSLDSAKFSEIVEHASDEDMFIIDGMQRTTALLHLEQTGDVLSRKMRIEFWVSKDISSLVYRMLVLNTGQVPWNLRRQIEVVFNSMIKEIRNNTDINILTIDNHAKRKAGYYQANDIIELFLVFGARKEKIDIKEKLTDEFTRLDFIEVSGDKNFAPIFYSSLRQLQKLDEILYNKKSIIPEEEMGIQQDRFMNGKDLFDSQTARVGFIAAQAIKILGRPGVTIDHTEVETRWLEVIKNFNIMADYLSGMSENEIFEFLDFPTLNQKLSAKVGRIGDFEREFFTKAFITLIEEKFALKTLTVCWSAY